MICLEQDFERPVPESFDGPLIGPIHLYSGAVTSAVVALMVAGNIVVSCSYAEWSILPYD